MILLGLAVSGRRGGTLDSNNWQTAVTIRNATSEDCAALAALAGQLGYASSAEQIASRLRYFDASAEHKILVAEAAGGVVLGWIGMYVVRTIASDARLEISGLIVDEKYRSLKIGELLLKRAEEWGFALGLSEVGVRTNVLRVRAHGFYERHGYRLEKTQRVFRKMRGR